MARDIKDKQGTVWNCVQAYAGLETENESDTPTVSPPKSVGNTRVVCTPSGGAQSVTLELPANWEDEYSDDEILSKIEHKSA